MWGPSLAQKVRAVSIFLLALTILVFSLLVEILYFRTVLQKNISLEAESALNFLEARITAYVETLELLPEVPDYLRDLAWLTDELQSQRHLVGVIAEEKGQILLNTFANQYLPPPEAFETCWEGFEAQAVRYACTQFEALPDRKFFLLLGVDISYEKQAYRNILILSFCIFLAASILLAAGFYYLEKLARRQKELERRLSASEKLAAMGKISAMVAHEIRNPLNSIVMGLQYLSETGKPNPELLETIKQEAYRLTELTGELLSYAKGFEIVLREVDAREIVKELALKFQPKAERWGITFVVEEPPGVKIRVDRRWCSRAIENLLRNAFEATPKGGTVKLFARREKDHLCFFVQDTGPGISAEIRKRLFEPFSTTKKSGFGLGLYLVRKVAETHGGRVSLETCSEGTLFKLCFPIVHEKGQHPSNRR